MMLVEHTKSIADYLKAVNTLYAQGITTEHSFRGDLAVLLGKMTGYVVVNEAQHINCGAPDLTLLSKDIPVGYVEAKDIDKNLNDKNYKPQFDRYKKALDNLIITDYLTFQLFRGEELVTSVTIGEVGNKGINPLVNQYNAFAEMIKDFALYNGKAIKDSKILAEFMAAKTQLLAEVIEKTITNSDENNSLRQQLKGFQEVLLPTMTDAQFADIYAQTIAYGMFVARLQDASNENFTRQKAATLIPQSNPFLRNLFQYIAGFDLDNNIKWLVDALADMFNYVDITAIHKEFVSKDKDPFLHFYEDFLTKYDKKLKNARGAYYTPLAVVKFIVQAVDDILKNDFQIANGLADNSKVNIEANGATTEYHKVQILDPATGTGTFLAEVVRNIYQRFENNAGMWDDYVKNHLIPRLNGFEIMMSPYTMAHLKLEMILREFGYDANNKNRLQIYLTDSLENPKENVPKLLFAQWLSNEAAEAEKIKNNVPVMVVLGNPPYSGESSNNGDWIKNLIEQYKKEPQNPLKNIPDTKWINNDYVKFIRFGQHFIHKNKEGILAYITDNSFLDSLTFRGMRYDLLNEFDKIYILNLHGNSLKQETTPDGSKDENVFDIMQGVSINIFVKTGKKQDNKLADVFHFDIFGKRNEKYNYLLDNSINRVKWEKLNPENPFFFFVPKNNDNKEEYEKGFKINEMFNLNGVGICSKRDETVFQNSKNELIGILNDFKNLSEAELKQKYKTEAKESRDKKTAFAKQNLLKFGIEEKYLQQINYRPFDTKWTYFTNKSKGFLAYPVYEIMQHFTKGKNFGLVVSKQCDSDWRYVFVTENIADLNLIATAAKFGGGYIFPLYLYHDNFGQTEKVANLNEATLTSFENRIGSVPAPEQILDYIYAVLHSPSYRARYKEFLKIDFPRIPYPQNAEYFNKMAAFGEKLRKLHLMENVVPQQNMANYNITGSSEVEKVKYEAGKVWINDTQYFDNVPQTAWEFYIGGYQPAQKWLKDRKGRTLSYEDIEHYQKIIFVLCETDGIMKKIG
ncbi:DNA methyltransferase [Bacteroidia bacterium]|nr:DNA methyltransferase [Bacteroidia bacterium]